MKNTSSLSRFLGAAAFVGLTAVANAQITPGNLVVVRFGDGSGPITNASTATFLEQYTTGGTAVNVIPMPVAAAGANLPFTNSGSSTSEGFLTQSSDSQYLVLGGYGTPPGSIGSIVTSASSVVPRVVARVDLSGAIDTTTALGDAYSGGNIRSACSDNGVQFWTGGSNDGVKYATLGATTSLVVNAGVTNVRTADIYAGQLYVSANSGMFHGPATVGIGLPTTAGNPTTLLLGFPTVSGSYYDYFFADPATVYVTNDASTGGIEKWIDIAGTWTLQYNLSPATGQGCRGLTGVVNGGVTTLYATTTQTTGNNLVTVTDTGAGSLFTILATAGTNMTYRGVRFVNGSGSTPTTSFCDGSVAGSCLGCGNNGAPGKGCANSSFAGGGQLTSTGVAGASAGTDTLVLTANDITGPGLFFQATGLNQITFGDGMLCAAAGIIRMGVVFPVAGSASYPGGITPNPIHIAGGTSSGDLRHYQCWYRDAVSFCTAATFNLTQGLSLTWGP